MSHQDKNPSTPLSGVDLLRASLSKRRPTPSNPSSAGGQFVARDAPSSPPKHPNKREVDAFAPFAPIYPEGWPAPPNYPGTDRWADDVLPPGSRHSHAEWARARKEESAGQEDASDTYYVFELLYAQGSVLVRRPRPREVLKSVNGKVEKILEVGPVEHDPSDLSVFAIALDGALVVCDGVQYDFEGGYHGSILWDDAPAMRVVQPREKYKPNATGSLYLDAVIKIYPRYSDQEEASKTTMK